MPRTLALDVLARVFEEHADRNLLVVPGAAPTTYRAFWRKAEGIARRLRVRGLGPQERLLLQLQNSEHVLALYLACAIGGFVACPVDPTLPKAQLAAARALLQPSMTLADADVPGLLEPIQGGPDLGVGEPDEDFLVVFSSGSTGEPKGIVHTLRSFVESARSFARLSGLSPSSAVYHHFPMFYMAGVFNLLFCPMVAGATIVVGPRFSKLSMLRFWDLPIEHGVNRLTLTPTMALSLCHLYRRDDRLHDHLAKYEAIVSTGSALYASVAQRFQQTFKVPLRSCYGVTEVGGSITLQAWEDAIAFESLGTWAPGVEIRAGTEGTPSEILVRTPFMAKAYLTKGDVVRPVDANGFFKTGDVGFVKEGRLFFSGREHDLVKKGGEFVSTQLIEDAALSNKLVTDAAAVSVPDEFWGSRVVLFYVPARDATEEEIAAEFARIFSEGLREIERPDKVIPVPWMPKTSVGKTKKRELVEKYDVHASGKA